MLFNSAVFILFFAVVYILYLLFRRSFRLQNLLLLVASTIFYGAWDWRLLSLLFLTALFTYVIALEIDKADPNTTDGKRRRKTLLIVGVAALIGVLGIFKYFGFFASSLQTLAGWFSIQVSPVTLEIVLPLGISFHTFQTLSYLIDIYRGKLKPTRSLVNLTTFIAFFPQVIAGPIERASNLLPQFEYPRRITAEQVHSGLYLFLWGMFKKVVIADRVAITANLVFNDYTRFHGLDLWIGVLAFAVQIYCDFSAYSDMARGIARLLGFELIINFRLPYFALNPTDFWNRWHISLSSWLRDYLYVPLGGSRHGAFNTYRNLFLTMLLGGLWHGAAWNFVFWGAYHGVILMIYRRFERRPAHRQPWGGEFPYPVIFFKMGLMFFLTLVGWLMFRATSTEQIFTMLTDFSPLVSAQTWALFRDVLIISLPLIIMQIVQYVRNDLLFVIGLSPLPQIVIYAALLVGILAFGVRESNEFIYFQF